MQKQTGNESNAVAVAQFSGVPPECCGPINPTGKARYINQGKLGHLVRTLDGLRGMVFKAAGKYEGRWCVQLFGGTTGFRIIGEVVWARTNQLVWCGTWQSKRRLRRKKKGVGHGN